MKTTTSVATGWRPDPSGGHELRLFSPEGDPTAHVSSAGLNSYEEMPGAVLVAPPRGRRTHAAAAAAGSSHRPRDDASADLRGRTQEGKRISGSRPGVQFDQMARLVARIALLTSVDPQRPVRRVMPAFSLILIAALLERN